MSQPFTGSPARGHVASEIQKRLRKALAPERLEVVNDSARHHGHAGDDGSGESHFTVEIVAAIFTGMSRVARQRAVNAALADLMRERIHALAIKARAPGEA
jgi:BolA protein